MRSFYPAWDQWYFEDLLSRFAVSRREKVRELSRGQSIKLMLALALAHRPEFLILDEPTSGLDPIARPDLLDLFRNCVIDERHGILFSTHIVGNLENVADLTSESKEQVIGIRHRRENVTGLILLTKTAHVGPDILIEAATLGGAVVHLSTAGTRTWVNP